MADAVPLLGNVLVQQSFDEEYVAKGAAGRATAGHAAASSNTQARGVNVERGGATSVHESRCSLGDGLPAVLLRQLPALLRLAQPWHALTLAAASVVEALLVARSGKVAGSFYRVLGDQDWSGLWHTVWLAAGIYLITSGVQAISHWLSELVAAGARLQVAGWLQRCYCDAGSFARVPSRVDNPDQRIANDTELWAEQLGRLAPIFATAPLKVVFYTHWMMQLTSLPAVGTVYLFFSLSSILQWTLLEPIAAAVFRQEALEGDLRSAHARLRACAAEAALCRGGPSEQAALQNRLAAAVANQRRLAAWHGLQAALTAALGYGGALIAYCSVGLAIFRTPQSEEHGGAAAERISNACFAALMLMNSFSQMVSASESMSSLAGLTSRLHRLIEELHALHLSAWRQGVTEALPNGMPVKAAESGVAAMVVAPHVTGAPSGTLEVSVHRLGPAARAELPSVLPAAPGRRPIHVVVTFQFARPSVSRALEADAFSDPPTAAQVAWQAEMDRMLDCFIGWATAVHDVLHSQGCWCDAIDPCSGVPLFGAAGERTWSEVGAAAALLGYTTSAHGPCPVVHHPVHGTAAYPATLLTDAQPGLLERALSEVAASSTASEAPLQQGVAQPLVSLRGVTYSAPSEHLSLDVAAGRAVLIEGPSGCGKSTLLRVLGGLHSVDSGSIHLPPPDQVMFLPQCAVVPPGASLRDQLSYGGPGRCSHHQMHRALHQVGLGHLLQRVHQDILLERDWAGQLSIGEVQRMAIARVLLRQPALVVLDEATSAMGDAVAIELYGLMKASGAALLSLGQCGTPLRALHDDVYVLTGCGSGLQRSGNADGSWCRIPPASA